MEIDGWENIQDPPVLLIGIRSGAPFVWDAWTVGLQWWRRFGRERQLHGTVHDALMAIPGFRRYFLAMGVTDFDGRCGWTGCCGSKCFHSPSRCPGELPRLHCHSCRCRPRSGPGSCRQPSSTMPRSAPMTTITSSANTTRCKKAFSAGRMRWRASAHSPCSAESRYVEQLLAED